MKKMGSLVTGQNGSFFVSAADCSNKSVTVWARYLSASEGSSLALLENAMDYWVVI